MNSHVGQVNILKALLKDLASHSAIWWTKPAERSSFLNRLLFLVVNNSTIDDSELMQHYRYIAKYF